MQYECDLKASDVPESQSPLTNPVPSQDNHRQHSPQNLPHTPFQKFQMEKRSLGSIKQPLFSNYAKESRLNLREKLKSFDQKRKMKPVVCLTERAERKTLQHKPQRFALICRQQNVEITLNLHVQSSLPSQTTDGPKFLESSPLTPNDNSSFQVFKPAQFKIPKPQKSQKQLNRKSVPKKPSKTLNSKQGEGPFSKSFIAKKDINKSLVVQKRKQRQTIINKSSYQNLKEQNSAVEYLQHEISQFLNRQESPPPFEVSREQSLVKLEPTTKKNFQFHHPYISKIQVQSKELARVEIDLIGEEAALCENDVDEQPDFKRVSIQQVKNFISKTDQKQSDKPLDKKKLKSNLFKRPIEFSPARLAQSKKKFMSPTQMFQPNMMSQTSISKKNARLSEKDYGNVEQLSETKQSDSNRIPRSNVFNTKQSSKVYVPEALKRQSNDDSSSKSLQPIEKPNYDFLDSEVKVLESDSSIMFEIADNSNTFENIENPNNVMLSQGQMLYPFQLRQANYAEDSFEIIALDPDFDTQKEVRKRFEQMGAKYNQNIIVSIKSSELGFNGPSSQTLIVENKLVFPEIPNQQPDYLKQLIV